MRYVKMLPVYGASCAFVPPPPPILFLPRSPLLSSTAFKSPKFALLSDGTGLLDVNYGHRSHKARIQKTAAAFEQRLLLIHSEHRRLTFFIIQILNHARGHQPGPPSPRFLPSCTADVALFSLRQTRLFSMAGKQRHCTAPLDSTDAASLLLSLFLLCRRIIACEVEVKPSRSQTKGSR